MTILEYDNLALAILQCYNLLFSDTATYGTGLPCSTAT